jgi:uncharacterized protein YcbX
VQAEVRAMAAAGAKGVDAEWGARELPMRRFRPNVVFAGAGLPFAEDAFREVTLARTRVPIACVSKCTRCRLPNVDPGTGAVDGAVPFKVLLSFRTGLAREPGLAGKSCFGVNGVPGAAGTIRVGDVLDVTEWLDADDR